MNRVCSTAFGRRLFSTPTAKHTTDEKEYRRQLGEGRADFLDDFGPKGNVDGERVLDLGCGLGAKTFAVARSGALEVIGIDTDDEKIRRATEAARDLGGSAVRFEAQCGSSLRFDSGCFDVVLLLDVIEHLPDPGAVLAECARVLRDGGRLLISFPPYLSPWGAHLFTYVPIPWVHLLFPEFEILELWREKHHAALESGEAWCSARRARAIIEANTTAALWDCNGMTIEWFLDLVDETPLELGPVRYKVLGNLEGLVKTMPRLREYLVTRVNAVLDA
ncbi:MAG: class I SAM-dependent methyltransferase [Thermoanaerobaculales bacterium]|nr:class I SAM-dependent methyltransferase [Thermoanaerobaculales bacterium]